MRAGTKVNIKPEAWDRYQVANGTNDPCPGEVAILYIADDRMSLRGYAYLGDPLYWWKVEDLV
jgi:hypothetical protein